MNFPKNYPRKKIEINIFHQGKIEKRSTIGSIVFPLMVVRRLRNHDGEMMVEPKGWAIYHVLSGQTLGIIGRYEFCKNVANDLLKEPILLLPTGKMMFLQKGYEDFINRKHQIIAKYDE